MTAVEVSRETVPDAIAAAQSIDLTTMPLELLQIGPNVRTDPGELEELAASIREFGVLQPVKVKSTAAGWTVMWGQRRVLAARLAGLARIPVIIESAAKPDSPAGIALEQLVENLQRADLNDEPVCDLAHCSQHAGHGGDHDVPPAKPARAKKAAG